MLKLSMPRKNTPHAFTLIELLVVIAIIAILAAILFPVFAKVREKARQTTCASNEKQLGFAVLAYVEDYDERLPLAIYKTSGTSYKWQYVVDPYIKGGFPVSSDAGLSLSVYFCPDYNPTLLNSTGGKPSSSYVVNSNLFGENDSNDTSPGTYWTSPSTLAQLNYPSQDVFFAEASGGCVWTDGDDNPSATSGDPNNPLTYSNDADTNRKGCDYRYLQARNRHTGGSNFAFGDGHVKWFIEPTQSNITATAVPAGFTPVQSNNTIVYSRGVSPNAAGWFTEN